MFENFEDLNVSINDLVTYCRVRGLQCFYNIFLVV